MQQLTAGESDMSFIAQPGLCTYPGAVEIPPKAAVQGG